MEEEKRLTITEIKHCEKASDICKKVGIASALFGGFTFLSSLVGFSIFSDKSIPILIRLSGEIISIVFMGLGCSLIEISHKSFVENEKMDELITKEKEYYRGL